VHSNGTAEVHVGFAVEEAIFSSMDVYQDWTIQK